MGRPWQLCKFCGFVLEVVASAPGPNSFPQTTRDLSEEMQGQLLLSLASNLDIIHANGLQLKHSAIITDIQHSDV